MYGSRWQLQVDGSVSPEEVVVDTKKLLEKMAMAMACVVVGVAMWFWSRQIMDVIEMLRLAYG